MDDSGSDSSLEETAVKLVDKPLICFKNNTSIILSGATQCGKTFWINRFLKNLDHMYEGDPPCEVLYYYSHYQPLYDEMKSNLCDKITFKEGIPSLAYLLEYANDNRHRLVCLDDVMHLIVDNSDISLIFTQLSHHKSLSCVVVLQNIFNHGRYARTISLNSTYLVLFNNVRDKAQISYLGKQIYPNKNKAFMGIYTDCVKRPYSYLLLDMSPNINDMYRLRTCIFPSENMVIYEL